MKVVLSGGANGGMLVDWPEGTATLYVPCPADDTLQDVYALSDDKTQGIYAGEVPNTGG